MARKRFNFWLDDKNTTDWQINELITTLKRAGQFTRAIREGLRLWTDLKANNTTVLFELFPHLKMQMTTPTPVADGGGQLDEIKSMLEMIAAQQQSNSGYVMKSIGDSAKPLPAPPKVEVKQSAAVSVDAMVDTFVSMFQ